MHQLNENSEIHVFIATWSAGELNESDQYLVSVHPPPPYGPMHWTNKGTTTTLNLERGTQYNITISSSLPYQKMSTCKFKIGYTIYSVFFLNHSTNPNLLFIYYELNGGSLVWHRQTLYLVKGLVSLVSMTCAGSK